MKGIWRGMVIFAVSLLIGCSHTFAGTTWTLDVDDSFNRANSSSIGNNWVDALGIGSISSNKLRVVMPSLSTTAITPASPQVRILRPSSESSLNQRIDITWTATTTGIGTARGAVLRGKSAIINGVDIQPALTVVARDAGALSFALSYNNANDYQTMTGTTTWTPIAGRSYTLSVSVLNNFPAVVSATVTDNASSTTVASSTFNVLGKYGATDLSPYSQLAGVAGIAFESNVGGKIVDITNVKTYTYSDPGSLTVPSAIKNFQHDGINYMATPLPTGGTSPYTIRWYRGANGFSPPTAIDGSGSGTGTYIGTGQEVTDSNAPTGVSNFSTSYKAVYFDSGANATSGIAGPIINLNSPTTKVLTAPLWIGDSITYGFNTSSNSPSTSPGKFAMDSISADSGVTNSYLLKFFNTTTIANTALSGRTSTDFATTYLGTVISMAAHYQTTVASIMLGTNDSKDSVSTSATTYQSNMQTVISSLQAVNPTMRIVLNKPLWFKPNTGYMADFSSSSLARIATYSAKLDQFANGTSTVIGTNSAYTEIETYGWTGTSTVNNPSNAISTYPPAPTGGRSYLADGLHPYDGGAKMVAAFEWYPNMKNAILGNFTTAYDQSPPAIAVTNPNDSSFLSGSVSFSATSSDASGVAGVKFYIDGVQQGVEDTAASYAILWDTTGVADGSHTLLAVARDTVGNIATSSSVTVTVDNSAPIIAFTSLSNGQSVGAGTVSITASSSDNIAIAGVQLYINGTTYGSEKTLSPYQWSLDASSMQNTTNTFTAVARDQAGNYATSSILVNILTNTIVLNSGGWFNTEYAQSQTLTQAIQQTESIFKNKNQPNITFAHVLKLGDEGEDVLLLQQLLNRDDFIVTRSGGGSPGHETTYFGAKTKVALMRFQKYYKIYPVSGIFGPLSQARMKALFSN